MIFHKSISMESQILNEGIYQLNIQKTQVFSHKNRFFKQNFIATTRSGVTKREKTKKTYMKQD